MAVEGRSTRAGGGRRRRPNGGGRWGAQISMAACGWRRGGVLQPSRGRWGAQAPRFLRGGLHTPAWPSCSPSRRPVCCPSDAEPVGTTAGAPQGRRPRAAVLLKLPAPQERQQRAAGCRQHGGLVCKARARASNRAEDADSPSSTSLACACAVLPRTQTRRCDTDGLCGTAIPRLQRLWRSPRSAVAPTRRPRLLLCPLAAGLLVKELGLPGGENPRGGDEG